MSRYTLILIVLYLLSPLGVGAQTTEFNYQGHLAAGGSPANGNFDFQFVLYSAPTGGSPILPVLAINGVPVVNGVFNVQLNFQNQFPGADRFLEIHVRPAGQGNHTLLSPRQKISSTPYSIKSVASETASNALQLGGLAPAQYVLTSDPRMSDARSPLPNSSSYIQNRTTPQSGSSFNISGNGTVGGSFLGREASIFEKSLVVGTTLDVGGAATVGSSLIVGTSASIGGTVNTGTQFNVGGNFVLNRSRLSLFNTTPVPRGYSFEVLNNPEFLVIKNEAGATLVTVAPDGKVGIGDNLPTQATLEVGGSVEISGSLSVGNMGGAVGEQLCRGLDNRIRACSAVGGNIAESPQAMASRIRALELTILDQQAEIKRNREELALLKKFICAQNPVAGVCNSR